MSKKAKLSNELEQNGETSLPAKKRDSGDQVQSVSQDAAGEPGATSNDVPDIAELQRILKPILTLPSFEEILKEAGVAVPEQIKGLEDAMEGLEDTMEGLDDPKQATPKTPAEEPEDRTT